MDVLQEQGRKMSYQDADTAPKDYQSPLEAAFAIRDLETPHLVTEALRAGRAKLAYQPVVLSRDLRTISFHEGLLRLLDDRGQVIQAAKFLPQVIDTDVGRQIDSLALELTLEMLRQRPDRRLSVNVSARSLGDWRWRSRLNEALTEAGHLGDRLILEISESSAMMLHEVVQRFMADVQPYGVCFALDGYGGGSLSFRHMSEFYFDLVKVDRHFTRGIAESSDNQVVLSALVSVARQFEMFVVADGVEDSRDAQFLRGCDIDCLQGYLTGRPLFQLD